ncbi:MAG: hypothetical protein V4616_00890 [Bacteroidota bacterium]
MKNFYELHIDSQLSSSDPIDRILNVNTDKRSDGRWCYTITQEKGEPYYDFINNFLDLLDGKYEQLLDLKITKDDIAIWHIYIHDGQCNLEFDPQRMKRLGDAGITLCISCYQDENIDYSN